MLNFKKLIFFLVTLIIATLPLKNKAALVDNKTQQYTATTISAKNTNFFVISQKIYKNENLDIGDVLYLIKFYNTKLSLKERRQINKFIENKLNKALIYSLDKQLLKTMKIAIKLTFFINRMLNYIEQKEVAAYLTNLHNKIIAPTLTQIDNLQHPSNDLLYLKRKYLQLKKQMHDRGKMYAHQIIENPFKEIEQEIGNIIEKLLSSPITKNDFSSKITKNEYEIIEQILLVYKKHYLNRIVHNHKLNNILKVILTNLNISEENFYRLLNKQKEIVSTKYKKFFNKPNNKPSEIQNFKSFFAGYFPFKETIKKAAKILEVPFNLKITAQFLKPANSPNPPTAFLKIRDFNNTVHNVVLKIDQLDSTKLGSTYLLVPTVINEKNTSSTITIVVQKGSLIKDDTNQQTYLWNPSFIPTLLHELAHAIHFLKTPILNGTLENNEKQFYCSVDDLNNTEIISIFFEKNTATKKELLKTLTSPHNTTHQKPTEMEISYLKHKLTRHLIKKQINFVSYLELWAELFNSNGSIAEIKNIFRQHTQYLCSKYPAIFNKINLNPKLLLLLILYNIKYPDYITVITQYIIGFIYAKRAAMLMKKQNNIDTNKNISPLKYPASAMDLLLNPRNIYLPPKLSIN